MMRHKIPNRSINLLETRKKNLEKRKITSYEDIPIEDYEEDDSIPKINLNKKTVQVIAIIAACMFAVLVWANWPNLQPDKIISFFQSGFTGISSNNSRANIQGSHLEKGNFKLMDTDAVALTDTSMTIFNKNLKELSRVKHSLTSPMMDIDGDMAIIYNRNGKDFQVESRNKELAKKTLGDNIICAAVSNSGFYGLVTTSKNYLAEFTAYSSDGSQKYKFYFADCYISGVALSSDGKGAVISGLISIDGVMKSYIYILDFNKQEPLHKIDCENNMIVSVDYLSNGNIAYVGDKYSGIIKASDGKKTDYNYNERSLISYNINPATGLSIALSDSSDGRNCSYALLDQNGGIQSDFKTDLKISAISLKGNTIALLANGKIYKYNSKGEKNNEIEVGSDALNILLSSPSSAYVLGVSEIKKVNF